MEDSNIYVGDRLAISRDVVVNGQVAFRMGEEVGIQKIAPNAERPEYRYVVTSDALGQKFVLRAADFTVPVEAQVQQQEFETVEHLAPQAPAPFAPVRSGDRPQVRGFDFRRYLRDHRMLVFAAAGVLVVVVVLLVFLVFMKGEPPQNVVKQFFTAVDNKDFNGMLACFDPSVIQTNQNLQTTLHQRFLEDPRQIYFSNIVSIDAVSGANGTEIMVTAPREDIPNCQTHLESQEVAEIATVGLVKKDGKWCITEFRCGHY